MLPDGKKYSIDVFKPRILGWGDYPRLSDWTLNMITNIILRGRQWEISREKEEANVAKEADTGVM